MDEADTETGTKQQRLNFFAVVDRTCAETCGSAHFICNSKWNKLVFFHLLVS